MERAAARSGPFPTQHWLLTDPGLSEPERQVAGAIGRGRSNSEISAELFMSVATAKAYVSRLLTKLELDNRVQVALLVHDAER
jgi:DNA-binding NarL/FixJ family response regulator